jgi:hypothetical protein
MKRSIILTSVLFSIALVCYAFAGMFDRYLELMDVLNAVLKTIFVTQLFVYLLIVVKWGKLSKRIRMKLLFLAKGLCKNQWINLFAAWLLSSFVLTPYIDVFCVSLWILGIIPLFLFGVIYWIIVFKMKQRKRWLSGLKAIYFYIITSIGQIMGFSIYYIAYILKWYVPSNEYCGIMWDFLGYKSYIGNEGGYILLEGMLELAICMAVPYLVLVVINAVRFILSSTR